MNDLLQPLVAPPTQDPPYDAADEKEQLRAEVAQQDSPSGASVDWRRVDGLGRRYLRQAGKDLRVATVVAHAAHQVHGLAGLVDALGFLRTFLTLYWRQMTPPTERLRGRLQALFWYVERTDFLLRRQGTPQPTEVAAATSALAALNVEMQTLMGEESPSLQVLVHQFGRLQTARVPIVAPPVTVAQTPVSAAAAAVGPSPAPPSKPDVPPATNLLRKAHLAGLSDQVAVVAHALRRADPADPRAYRLLRVGIWLPVHTLPQQQDGRTHLSSLAPACLSALQASLEERRWLDVLEAAEDNLPTNRFSLDLQRHAGEALQQLGPRFSAAYGALIDEVMSLLRRLPELPFLLAADGTPLCHPATTAWLNSLCVEKGARVRMPQPNAAPRAPLTQTAGARKTFLQRLKRAESYADGGHGRVAAALYASLARELQKNTLDHWEPQLTTRVLTGYLKCHTSTSRPLTESVEAVFERLAAVDPDAALQATQ